MTIITYQKATYQVLPEDPTRRCTGCEFDDQELCSCPNHFAFPDCYGDHVIFKEIKPQNNTNDNNDSKL